MLHVTIVPRTLRFRRPAGTSRGVYTLRRLWYVVILGDHSGTFGLGECAPLYDLSADYTAHYEERLRGSANALEQLLNDKASPATISAYTAALPSSISMGFETAYRSLLASQTGDYRQIFDTPFTSGEQGITINGLVWMGRYDEMLCRMEEKLKSGFQCVKLKIGAIDFQQELDLLHRLRARFSASDVELRVDANGAFSPTEAPARLEALSRYDIHSIEQPLRAGQWEAMGALCRQSPLPIALDEELIGIDDDCERQTLLDTIRPHYLVLKPTLHGGFYGAESWMRFAATRDIPYWVTSALESNVGLNAIAQWTAATAQRVWEVHSPADGHRHQLPHIHGLGTGQLFEENYNDIHLNIKGDQLWADANAAIADYRRFLHRWAGNTPTLTLTTSGSTGRPCPLTVHKWQMRASARMTLRFLSLKEKDTALLCLPLRYIAGMMMAVRAEVGHLRLYVRAASAHPLRTMCFAPTFVAMTPQQVWETLQVPREAALLRRVRHLIIGGGAISAPLADALRAFPNNVWSTYGMTETLSHIAMRRLSGPEATERYTPLPGVTISHNADGCLALAAPALGVTHLVTNDLCDLYPDGTFQLRGRRDNVVCSGGIKLQIEELEEKIRAAVGTMPLPTFVLTAVPNEKLGEKLVMLYEDTEKGDAPSERLMGIPIKKQFEQLCRDHLGRYEIPKDYIAVPAIPMTTTGKPARAQIRQLARRFV